MKKSLFCALVLSAFNSFSQNTNPYPTTGNLGLGIAAANFHLQLHGTTDYSITVPGTPAVYDIFGNLITPAQAGYVQNYGKTARLGLTNTTSGSASTDGLLLRMSALNGVIENLEKQNLTLTSGGASLTFSGTSNRAWFSSVPGTPTSSVNGYLNVITSDNGLFIKNNITGKYGLSVQPTTATDIAMQVVGTDGTTRSFVVQGNGNVFARKYTTTLANIPDYVFKPTYQLMPMSDLRDFIKTNSHLPNVPSAKEYEDKGVDLGEMNRVLLEKVEELTLYILQLEDRVNSLESK